MGPTPLCDALRAFAAQNPLRMHMPGHKGKSTPLIELSAAATLDFTELPPTGDLFEGDGPIREAERLWARAFHMEECLFLTGGSTQGMLAAITLATTQDKGRANILMDRCSHRSVYNALALLDLVPAYLERPWLGEAGVLGPISPQAVENQLQKRPDINTVCVTSPSYYGVLSDIAAVADVVHAHGGKLIVDAAHGAHLPFLGNDHLSAADLVVASAHKTLPAPGQSALLFSGASGRTRPAYSHGDLRRAAGLYGSSSPSYLLMAGLDAARAWMEDEGRRGYQESVGRVAHLRERYPALTERDAPLDPARFVLLSENGFTVQERLEDLGVYPEMADSGHVVFIITCADDAEDVERLEAALQKAAAAASTRPAVHPCPLPPEPEVIFSPRKARFALVETIPLNAAAGRISACQIAPYPPGVPVVAPGELIGKKHLAYLDKIGYNMEQDVQVVAL